MSEATALLTYVWHYVFARTLYDDLLRPVLHGRAPALLIFVLAIVAAFFVGRLTGRRV